VKAFSFNVFTSAECILSSISSGTPFAFEIGEIYVLLFSCLRWIPTPRIADLLRMSITFRFSAIILAYNCAFCSSKAATLPSSVAIVLAWACMVASNRLFTSINL
jgi:hypothetical protein